MIEIKDKVNCCGCHGCKNICPVDAITMKEDEYGFRYPEVDKNKCINCGLCEKACPIINIKNIENKPKAYACFNNNESVRLESSSGGIFTLLAEYIIENNGVVFGAAFNDSFMVSHIKIEFKEEIEKLRTSKYLQSNIENTYKECKSILEENRLVLFTGTPCQIEGLLSYLNKIYNNLYTQDIICHGVPSPKVWKDYLTYRKNNDKEEPKKISFRNKDNGWMTFNLKFSYVDKNYSKNQREDAYMRAFLKNIDLRKSCYNCSFKKEHRLSDITLADFWGIQMYLPEMDDNKGTSLVIVNSEKGEFLLNNIKNNIKVKDVDLDIVFKTNPAFTKSSVQHKDREKFLNEVNSTNFEKIVNKYIKKPNIIQKIIKKIKRKLK